MKFTPDQVRQILEELTQEYNLDEDGGAYEEYVGILAVVAPEKGEYEYYILIGLTRPLPSNLSLPQGMYKGVKVVVEDGWQGSA